MTGVLADEPLWLVGAGSMAGEYARVLSELGQSFAVVGRSKESAATFEEVSGVPVHSGGLRSALSAADSPETAIVAVGVDQLAIVTSALVEAGVRRVLVEKPAGLNSREIQALQLTANQMGSEVLVAYNRRFYASVTTARRIIEEDGGATSCTFEVGEYSEKISELDYPESVKASWFLANTSHVLDLVINLIGAPAELAPYTSGSLSWHPAAAQFTGSGLTEFGIPFSYHGDWEAPGRWGLELCTSRRRLVLRPLEELQMIVPGTEGAKSVDIDDRLDQEFKPGLYRLAKAFLEGDDHLLCPIGEQVRNCRIYDQIAGYRDSAESIFDSGAL